MRTYTKDVKVWRRNVVEELPDGRAMVTWHDDSQATYENFETAVSEVEKNE